MARGCALIDSRLDTAKICSDKRVHVDHAQLPAVFGGEKTFSHGLGQNRKSSSRAYVFRFAPESGRRATWSACPFRAMKRHAQRRSLRRLGRAGSRVPQKVSSVSSMDRERKSPPRLGGARPSLAVTTAHVAVSQTASFGPAV